MIKFIVSQLQGTNRNDYSSENDSASALKLAAALKRDLDPYQYSFYEVSGIRTTVRIAEIPSRGSASRYKSST